ncbi:MAG TPA: hypothetical protein VFE36_06160 [Candidatus Baltobacteraceae bacterium]|jgi:hypothetical protein|nr:hypothetical protein [Candidatus Baltobacteraceae bacterium]
MWRTVVWLVLCAALCACSSPRASDPADQAQTSASTLQYKPGSHEARVIERIQQFRKTHREEFKTFMAAFAASHGDVNHPELARLRQRIAGWINLSDADYALLPVYMKTFSGTGPYRRLVTKPGYSYAAGTVFLPCGATHVDPTFEVAFAYIGGWGVGIAGKAVDAGFQRSNAYDDYAAFINAQGFPQISKEPRFPCGHAIDFRFYAASDTALRLWTKGLTENHRIEVVEARLTHPANYGWPANGGGPINGIVLKRMTTIGQNDATNKLPKGVEWDADGSYFGIDASGRPQVRWSNLVVGQVDAHGNPVGVVPWNFDRMDESDRAGMFDYPNDPLVIQFTCTGCTDEVDAINLKKR